MTKEPLHRVMLKAVCSEDHTVAIARAMRASDLKFISGEMTTIGEDVHSIVKDNICALRPHD